MSLPLSLRFAGRELRSGVRGFRIFLACLALGVAAIAAASSTAEAFRQGLAAQAREILGGDLSVTIRQRGFTAAEQATLGKAGRVAYAAGTQAMASSPAGERRLVEIRGVDGRYPLAGVVELQGAANPIPKEKESGAETPVQFFARGAEPPASLGGSPAKDGRRRRAYHGKGNARRRQASVTYGA